MIVDEGGVFGRGAGINRVEALSEFLGGTFCIINDLIGNRMWTSALLSVDNLSAANIVVHCSRFLVL